MATIACIPYLLAEDMGVHTVLVPFMAGKLADGSRFGKTAGLTHQT